LKVELKESIEEFAVYLAINTFSAGPKKQGIPYEWAIIEPDRFDKVRDELNIKSDDICIKYDTIVKLARRKLYSD